MYRDHRKGPGGPPGGATYPGGPHGLKWEGNQPLVGWCAPPGPPSAPRVGNPRGGGASTCLGGQGTPLGRRPPRRSHLLGPEPPLGTLYIEGEGGQPHPCTCRLPSPLLHLSLPQTLGEALPGSLLHPPPRRRAARSSSTSPSPLLDQEGGDVFLNRTCVERGGVVRSALGSPVIGSRRE